MGRGGHSGGHSGGRSGSRSGSNSGSHSSLKSGTSYGHYYGYGSGSHYSYGSSSGSSDGTGTAGAAAIIFSIFGAIGVLAIMIYALKKCCSDNISSETVDENNSIPVDEQLLKTTVPSTPAKYDEIMIGSSPSYGFNVGNESSENHPLANPSTMIPASHIDVESSPFLSESPAYGFKTHKDAVNLLQCPVAGTTLPGPSPEPPPYNTIVERSSAPVIQKYN